MLSDSKKVLIFVQQLNNGSVAQLDRAAASNRGHYSRNTLIELLEFGETFQVMLMVIPSQTSEMRKCVETKGEAS